MKNPWTFIKKSDIFSHFISIKYLPRWLVLLVDVLLCTFSFVFSYFIVSHLSVSNDEILNLALPGRLVILLFFQIIFFWLFHTYSGILRYSGYVDAAKLLFAVFSNVVLLMVITFLVKSLLDLNIYYYYSLLFYGVISFFLLFFIRLSAKTVFDFISENAGNSLPVMIYGTQSAGIAIAKMLRTNEKMKYKLVGFVDDDRRSIEKVVMGVRVY